MLSSFSEHVIGRWEEVIYTSKTSFLWQPPLHMYTLVRPRLCSSDTSFLPHSATSSVWVQRFNAREPGQAEAETLVWGLHAHPCQGAAAIAAAAAAPAAGCRWKKTHHRCWRCQKSLNESKLRKQDRSLSATQLYRFYHVINQIKSTGTSKEQEKQCRLFSHIPWRQVMTPNPTTTELSKCGADHTACTGMKKWMQSWFLK